MFEPSHMNVRIKISALWTSLLFVFAYVDLFSLYRSDFRADLDAGDRLLRPDVAEGARLIGRPSDD